jgi:hypothetical protein
MNDVRRDDIADIRKSLRDIPGEQNHAFAAARLFFRSAEREQIVDRNELTKTSGNTRSRSAPRGHSLLRCAYLERPLFKKR